MKHKKRVLLFVDRMRHGGIQQFLLENIRYMDKETLQIDVVTLDDGTTYPLEQQIQEAGATYYKLKGIWIRSPFDYLKYAKALNQFFKENNDYDVVHMNGSSKNFLLLKYAKKYKVPIRIVHSHNIDFQTKNPIKKLVGNMFKRPLKAYATDYFACSKLAGNWLFGENSKVTVIPNGIQYKKFQFRQDIREQLRKEFGFSDTDIVVGNVGRFTTQKNHEFLIEIFYEIVKMNDNAKLLLVGIGEKEDEIKEKVKQLGLENKVVFAGFRKDVANIMNAMDVFLLPSLYEGLPVVGVEAQASGLPCFMSKDVITEEVNITGNVTFLCLQDSPKQWAETILEHDLSRKDTYQALKEKGYFIEDTARELGEYYCH